MSDRQSWTMTGAGTGSIPSEPLLLIDQQAIPATPESVARWYIEGNRGIAPVDDANDLVASTLTIRAGSPWRAEVVVAQRNRIATYAADVASIGPDGLDVVGEWVLVGER